MALIAEFVAPEFIRETLSRIDISISSLRDALRGADNRTLTDVYNMLSAIKSKTDLLTFDANNFLRVNVSATVNPPALDVNLSTRASETTLSGFSGKFPSAVTLADNLSNPTTTLVGSCELVWDGSNWRRLGGAAVDVIGSTRTALGVIPMWLPSRQAFLVDNISVTTTEGSTSIASPGAKILIIKNKGDVDAQIGLNASVPTTNPMIVRARTVRVIVHSGVTTVFYKTAAGSTTLEIAYFN